MLKANSEILDRLPPSDKSAEQWVIGSVMLDNGALDEISQLRPEHFYGESYRILFRAMLAMREARLAIDPVTLIDYLRTAGQFDAVGGISAIADVSMAIPVASHVAHYADIVRAKWVQREVIAACTEALREAWEPTIEIGDCLSALEGRVARIETGAVEDQPKRIGEVAIKAMERIYAIHAAKSTVGVPLGFAEIDARMGGLFPGELTILAARPSIGKTALATQISEHVAERGKPVYFASLEMRDVEITTRVLCSRAEVSSHFLRSARISDDDLVRLRDATAAVYDLPLIIETRRGGMSTSDIRRSARRLMREGLGMIVVDYLQRIRESDRREERYLSIGRMVRDLKDLAQEANVPVLCLAQLGRSAENVKPELHHLKESGDIEQDADTVILLQRIGRGEDTDLHVAKQRNGDTGDFKLKFDGKRTRFIDVSVSAWEG